MRQTSRQPDARSPDVRTDFIRQIGDALRSAHGRRIIHRALSPQSILVTGPDSRFPTEQLKVLD